MIGFDDAAIYTFRVAAGFRESDLSDAWRKFATGVRRLTGSLHAATRLMRRLEEQIYVGPIPAVSHHTLVKLLHQRALRR